MKRIDIHGQYKINGNYNSATKWLLPAIQLPIPLIDYQKLWTCGFLGVFLLDKTEGKKLYHLNSIMLAFNPSNSFYLDKWDYLKELLVKRPNFIEYIDYGGLVFSFWLSVDPKFGKNMRYFFRHGFYSELPQNYKIWLNDTEKKIANRDEGFQKNLEFRLGLSEGDLQGIELESIPDKESYTFKMESNEI